MIETSLFSEAINKNMKLKIIFWMIENIENSNLPSTDETVKIYSSKNDMHHKFCHSPTKELLVHEQNSSNRVASICWYNEGFAKKITTFKTKSGESSLVLKNKNKKWRIMIYLTSS